MTELKLPEGIEQVGEMDKATREKLVAETIQRKRERMEKNLAEMAVRLEEKLRDKSAEDRQLIIRRVQLSVLAGKIKDSRLAMKQLRGEIKAIRAQNKQKEKGVVLQKKEKKSA